MKAVVTTLLDLSHQTVVAVRKEEHLPSFLFKYYFLKRIIRVMIKLMMTTVIITQANQRQQFVGLLFWQQQLVCVGVGGGLLL